MPRQWRYKEQSSICNICHRRRAAHRCNPAPCFFVFRIFNSALCFCSPRCYGIDGNIEITGSATSVADSLSWLKNNTVPDLILMDIQLSDGLSFHILKDNKSYNTEIVSHNVAEKTLQIKVNQTIYNVSVKDKYDELLHQLGLDKVLSNKLSNIKAPMPGMVLNILVADGAEVKKGDALIVLEAMKMENILKSPADAKVKSISVKKGMAVEKNQTLIEFA